jgi:selenocysteine lyase/cysteine desulfurase
MSVVALNELAGWSVAGIQTRIGAIADAVIAGAARHGYRAPIERAPHLFGLRREGGLPAGLGKALLAAGVHVSLRGDAIRVSPHAYNDLADAERLIDVLGTIQ